MQSSRLWRYPAGVIPSPASFVKQQTHDYILPQRQRDHPDFIQTSSDLSKVIKTIENTNSVKEPSYFAMDMTNAVLTGLASESPSLVTHTKATYSAIIDSSEDNQVKICFRRLQQESTTAGTIHKLLSQSDIADSRAYRELVVPRLGKIEEALKKTTMMLPSIDGRSSMAKRVRWATRNRERVESQIEQISTYNSDLLLLVNQLTHGAAMEQMSRNEDFLFRASHSIRNLLELLGPAGSNTDHHSLRQKGKLLEKLVSSCDSLFLLTTEAQGTFTDAFNRFRLWELDIKSEGLYKAIDLSIPDYSESQRNAIVTILFHSVMRIIKVCGKSLL
jgi:hypothetical protein